MALKFPFNFLIRVYVLIRTTFSFQFPRTTDEWMNISQCFEERWNFPHCLRAMDGKHVSIILPTGSGSEFYNYKGWHSMVLLAIVDAHYRFLMCDFGLLNIPAEETIRNTSRRLPYVFVADDAFSLRVNILKPFRQGDLTSMERKIYNYRLSRARRIVENVFGTVAARFRIFHTNINLEPRNIDSVVMACCVLHNFFYGISATDTCTSRLFR